MIEIARQPDGITVSGHAGYAPPGQDIICAAVSALTQTFISSVDKLTTDDIKSDTGPGMARIRYTGNLSKEAQLLEDSFFLGVRMISEEYPANVRIVQAGEHVKSSGMKDKQKS